MRDGRVGLAGAHRGDKLRSGRRVVLRRPRAPLCYRSAVAGPRSPGAATKHLGRCRGGLLRAILGEDEVPGLDCPEAQPGIRSISSLPSSATPASRWRARSAGGTPVSPEPLVGARGYEGFAWWSGPLTSAELATSVGKPRANWNKSTTPQAAHVPFGDTVRLTARVRDRVDIAEVRFRAWYPDWPRTRPSGELAQFDPGSTWAAARGLQTARNRGSFRLHLEGLIAGTRWLRIPGTPPPRPSLPPRPGCRVRAQP